MTQQESRAGAVNRVIAGRWEVGEKIGQGSFGEVYGGKDIHTGDHVAIKRERMSCTSQQLQHEYQCYQLLKGVDGFPAIYYGGQEGEFNVLVMERLGPSIKELAQNSYTKQIPLQTVVFIAPQIIDRIRTIHERGLVFRDVKAGQFCVGQYGDDIKNNPKVYMIDLGLAKKFQDEQGRHIPNSKPNANKSKTGTARYASLNVHRGRDHTRRDDIESLGYFLVEIAKGKLPWSTVQARTSRDGWRKTLSFKANVSLQDLTEELPDEFRLLLEHARSLAFSERPNYDMLKKLFTDLYRERWGDKLSMAWDVKPSRRVSQEWQETSGGITTGWS
ncbi:kinase-like domain-containing protein [Phlyctochytrium arcticum]|nr:kinase-like domain-containing protein [Phlyctochytrium arcticum]